jgi:probable rRNA maturation factor
MAVTFQTQDIRFHLTEKQRLKRWIRQVVLNEKKLAGQINFIFTSDEALLKINIRYLQHDTYTDIITFDYGRDQTVEGDVMISVDRVKENASKYKVNDTTELRRVIIHGVLHLCGYKDKTKSDAALMRKKENKALKLLESIQRIS